MLLKIGSVSIPGRGRVGGDYWETDVFGFFVWMLLKIGLFMCVKISPVTHWECGHFFGCTSHFNTTSLLIL